MDRRLGRGRGRHARQTDALPGTERELLMTPQQLSLLARGTVIPAHPLALDASRRLSERHQRALTRYYLAAGAGGLAVGVHTTQLQIREKQYGLLRPVLELAHETAAETDRPLLLVAGICGPTEQAVAEAELARGIGYDLGLLSLGGLGHWSEDELIRHGRAVGHVMPLFGFYLQPAVGGRLLSHGFWREFAAIPAVRAIKIA